MKRKLLYFASVLVLFTVAAIFILPQTILKPKPIHIHAGFHVYKDDKLVDFSNFKYMHEAPCTVSGKPVANAHPDEQLEKAHLHDQTGDVVHVHRAGAKWGDLFQNIKYQIPDSAVGYVNGKKVDSILSSKINAYDSVVIFVGKHRDDAKYLKDAVKKPYIQQIEKKSETCGAT